MTVLTMSARAEGDARSRPVPWRRMVWVTWRQHRTALAGVAVPLGALAVYVWLAGLQQYHAWTAVVACHPAGSLACVELVGNFNDTYGSRAQAVEFLLQAVPALIGAFVGAPVLARELETGTFRFTWTQGFGRWRWALAKLVPLAIAVAVAAGSFGVLFSWYVQPLLVDGVQTPLAPVVFDLRGVAFAGWTLVCFAIGALAGILIRRVVPAIVVTLVAYVGLALGVGLFLRQHYAVPLVTRDLNVPGSGWIMSRWWTAGGRFAFAGRPPAGLAMQICPHPPLGSQVGKPSPETITQCFVEHGYTQWTSYQPASRFWPFQWIEGGWLLALSALLIAGTVWLVRRRAT